MKNKLQYTAVVLALAAAAALAAASFQTLAGPRVHAAPAAEASAR